MKKVCTFILTATLLLTLAACGNGGYAPAENNNASQNESDSTAVGTNTLTAEELLVGRWDLIDGSWHEFWDIRKIVFFEDEHFAVVRGDRDISHWYLSDDDWLGFYSGNRYGFIDYEPFQLIGDTLIVDLYNLQRVASFIDNSSADCVFSGRWFDTKEEEAIIVFFPDGGFARGNIEDLMRIGGIDNDRLYLMDDTGWVEAGFHFNVTETRLEITNEYSETLVFQRMPM